MWQEQVRPRFRLTRSVALRTRSGRRFRLFETTCLLVPDRFFQHKLLQSADHFSRRRPCLFESVYLLVPDRFFQLSDSECLRLSETMYLLVQEQLFQPADRVGRRRPCLLVSTCLPVRIHFSRS